MAAVVPLVRGSLAGHPLAGAFAGEVLRIHRRYAGEIVAANGLCPFLRDVDTAFGGFCILLEPPDAVADPSSTAPPAGLDVDAAVAAVLASASSVVHLVYPCLRPPTSAFEKFAGRLAGALKRAIPSPPVMAAFHPDLTGDAGDPYRLVGLLRRAPDPFIQLIPEGLHAGGTVFAGFEDVRPPQPANPAVANFTRLRGPALDRLFALLAEIHADRAASFAPFLAAFGCAPTTPSPLPRPLAP